MAIKFPEHIITFKAFLLSLLLFLHGNVWAKTFTAQETTLKTSINQMIVLIDEQNFVDLINDYAYLEEEQKKEIVIKLRKMNSLDEVGYLKKALVKASTITPIFNNEEATIIFTDTMPDMIFVLNKDKWQLKN